MSISDKPTTLNSTDPSTNALSVHGSFVRALETSFPSTILFSEAERLLAKHMLTIALKNENVGYWSFFQTPYSVQRILLDQLVWPGFDNHSLAKKYLIKEKITDAIYQNGVEQIIILGGGYDIYGFHTSLNNDHVQVFELDKPGKMRNVKVTAMRDAWCYNSLSHFTGENQQDAYSFTLNDNYHLICCDMSTDNIKDKLTEYGFNSDKKTLVIAEGLAMHLNESASRQLLKKQLFPLLSVGSEILISYISSNTTTLIAHHLLSSRNEAYEFALSPKKIPLYAANLGYHLTGKMLASDLLKLANDDKNASLLTRNQTMPDGRGGESYFCFTKNIKSLDEIKSIELSPIDTIPIINDTVLRPDKSQNNIL